MAMVRKGGHPDFDIEGAKGSAFGSGHNLPKTGKSYCSVVHRHSECGNSSTLWKQQASSSTNINELYLQLIFTHQAN